MCTASGTDHDSVCRDLLCMAMDVRDCALPLTVLAPTHRRFGLVDQRLGGNRVAIGVLEDAVHSNLGILHSHAMARAIALSVFRLD